MKATLSFGLKALTASLAVIAGMAHAASTYQFTGNGTYDAQSEQYATTGYTAADAKLTISGVYATNLSTGVADSTKTWNSNTASQPLYFGGNGLGMCSDPVSPGTNGGCPTSNPPNHAIDNVGNTEAILMSFSNSVVLQQIGLGFVSGDSDFSVFRYTGTTAPVLTNVKASASAMTTAGWELVGNYADTPVDNSAPFTSINSGAKTSSWWLITAYNSGIGGTAVTGSGTLSNGDDYFKIFAVNAQTSCTSGVNATTGACNGTNVGKLPEPTTLALTSIAMVGVAGLRRRKAKQAA